MMKPSSYQCIDNARELLDVHLKAKNFDRVMSICQELNDLAMEFGFKVILNHNIIMQTEDKENG